MTTRNDGLVNRIKYSISCAEIGKYQVLILPIKISSFVKNVTIGPLNTAVIVKL